MSAAEITAPTPETTVDARPLRVALAGVPNCGKTALFNALTGARQKVVDLNEGVWRNSFTADMAVDPAGRLIFVIDQANFRVAIVDAKKGRAFALRTVWSEPGASGYLGSSRMWRARSWDDFRAARNAWTGGLCPSARQ